MEQASRRWRGKQCGDLATATRLTEDGDVPCISAKGFYILIHPLQCRHQVKQSGIARFCIFIAIGGKVEKTQDVETMIQRHNHCIPFLCQICSVIRGKLLTTAGGITSTMQPHHDGAFLPVFQSRCPDIHPQTVFIGITVIPVEGKRLLVAVPSHALALRTSRAVGTTTADAFPFVNCHGRHKTFGFGIWNTFIYIDTIFHISGYFSRFGLGNGGCRRSRNLPLLPTSRCFLYFSCPSARGK